MKAKVKVCVYTNRVCVCVLFYGFCNIIHNHGIFSLDYFNTARRCPKTNHALKNIEPRYRKCRMFQGNYVYDGIFVNLA